MEIQVGSIPSRQAKSLSLEEMVAFLNIDFRPGNTEYRWSLQEDHKCPSNLPLRWKGIAIHKIQHLRRTLPESFARRIISTVTAERLGVLDDRLASTHFVMKYKLPIKAITAEHGKIVARAHWSLAYKDRDNNRHWKLVVVGTNDWKNTLSELLFCVGAIQGDRPVFGIATDGIGFMFVAIHNRKVFVSGIVDWFEENELVVYFFDYILRDMIESCSMDNMQSPVDDLEDI